MGLAGNKGVNSKNVYHETPKTGLLGKGPYTLPDLIKEFNLTLDPCAPIEAKKDSNRSCCVHFFTEEENGLAQPWTENAFVNPVYMPKTLDPHNNIELWIEKTITEAMVNRTVNVMLLPAYTDADWYHDQVLGIATEIRHIRGRVKFWKDGKPTTGSPNFASDIIVYDFRGRRPWDK